jgi:anti-sigma factor RsiW
VHRYIPFTQFNACFMTEEQQLELQSFLDGELPEKEARNVAAWLARDAEATALANELRNTRKALAGFEPGLKLPETREFYWSKIEREIQRLEPVPAPGAEPVSLFVLLRRLLALTTAFVAIAIVGILAARQFGPGGHAQTLAMETTLADASAFTYRDQAQGMTVVWLSYPAENEFTRPGLHDTLPQK